MDSLEAVMRLVLASDIHYGNMSSCEGDAPFFTANHKEFAKRIHDEKPDVLLVTGDCAEGMLGDDALLRFLEVYANPHGDSICIPGNHDVWLQYPEKDPEEKYQRFISLARRQGWTVLVDDAFCHCPSGVWFAGNMCWYDFSHIDNGVNKTPKDYEREKQWSDYEFMRMGSACGSETPMMDYCAKRMAEFKNSLAEVPADRKFLVVASHFVGFPRLLSYFRDKDYFQSFMANNEIGELAAKANAQLYVCGHTHRRKEFMLGDMRCINNGSGYGLGSKVYDVIEIP